MGTPTYDELKKRGGGRPGGVSWTDFLDEMAPGDVREVAERPGSTIKFQQNGLRAAARRKGLPVATRVRDGKLYAVYLKPEDANGHG